MSHTKQINGSKKKDDCDCTKVKAPRDERTAFHLRGGGRKGGGGRGGGGEVAVMIHKP